MKHLESDEKYQGLEKIKSPLVKQFEYFRINLQDVKHLDFTSMWPRNYQEDLRDLSLKISKLDSFEDYWGLRNDKPKSFVAYLEKVSQSIKV